MSSWLLPSAMNRSRTPSSAAAQASRLVRLDATLLNFTLPPVRGIICQQTPASIGAYQGNYLFLGRNGVFTSTSLEGARWPALVRTSDGRLAPPSAVAQ